MAHIKTLLFIFFAAVIWHGCGKDPNNGPTDPGTTPVPSSRITVINDVFESVPVVVAGSPGLNFIVSYSSLLSDSTQLTFEPIQGSLPEIMEDQEGNIWSIFGFAVSGPREGEELEILHSFMGYWFSFSSMYPGVELYSGGAEDVNVDLQPSDGWSIPAQFVFQASGKDAIQAVDDPPIIEYADNEYPNGEFYVGKEDLVTGYYDGTVMRAYPHLILDWHEIINDNIGDRPIAVVYCPLTGTGTIWDRRLSEGQSLFGVSGLLYNNNLIPFDRKTESYWNQIDEQCVKGSLSGEKAQRIRSVEMSWEAWVSIFFRTDVVSKETGLGKPYGNYPYGDYKTNQDFVPFPLVHTDMRVPRKERVHAFIANGKAKVYRFSDF